MLPSHHLTAAGVSGSDVMIGGVSLTLSWSGEYCNDQSNSLVLGYSTVQSVQ